MMPFTLLKYDSTISGIALWIIEYNDYLWLLAFASIDEFKTSCKMKVVLACWACRKLWHL
jgi:hypothetical protein